MLLGGVLLDVHGGLGRGGTMSVREREGCGDCMDEVRVDGEIGWEV